MYVTCEEVLVEVKFKLLSPGCEPTQAYSGDAGWDLYARAREWSGNNLVTYHLGVAVEIPPGYVGLVFPRSSICTSCLYLSNSVGVIDSGYRGELRAIFRQDTSSRALTYEAGAKVAQLIIIPYPHVELVQADTLNESERGAKGFGSSDKVAEPEPPPEPIVEKKSKHKLWKNNKKKD